MDHLCTRISDLLNASQQYGKINGKSFNAAKDKTTIIYNELIVIDNVPLETQKYIDNMMRVLDWQLEMLYNN